MGSGTYNYYVSSYFGSCHYYFILSDFDVSAEPFNGTMGHLIIQIEEIPWDSRLSGNGNQLLDNDSARGRADRRGGSDVTRQMRGPIPRANGLDAA
jgi:hypothetical protein